MNSRKSCTLLITFFLSLLTTPEVCFSAIFSYTDDQGILHFTNVPSSNPNYQLHSLHSPAHRSRELIFDSHIYAAAHRYQIDPLLIKAVIKQESDFNPYAKSNKGALGLMQLMPGTAQDMMVGDIFDPRDNIFGGTKYLRKLYTMFDGDLRLVLASYNAGPTIVMATRTIPDISETKNYVRAVLSHYSSYKNR